MKKTNEKKNSKGITLVSLVITIVLMLIIISTTGYVSLERFKINKFNKMKNDIQLLSDKVSNYYLKYNEIPVLRDSENNPIEYTYTSLEFDKNLNDNDKYYILNLEAMEGISLNYGKKGFNNPNSSDDVYIINEKTHQIYYVLGIEVDNIIYHALPNKGETKTNDDIPPTKPQIKIISGEKNEEGNYISDVSIEIIPGKDNGSGIEKTTYSINDQEEKEISTLDNNILTITDNGNYNIKVRSYDKSDNANASQYATIDIILKNTNVYFITKWNVTLGETEGNQTYSTIVLPVYKNSTYDATIYWGDGTSTLLQHNTNGVTLTDAELIEKVTHNYTLAENDDAIRTISIEGIYTRFSMNSTTSVPTKLKLIGIEQWGNTGFTSINFANCTNLGGMIPKNDLIELNSSEYCFQNTGIIGLEEGFHFTGGTSLRFLFSGCSNLKILPDDFTIPEGVNYINHMFYNCTSLESLPENFTIPSGVKAAQQMFAQCSKLKKLPDNFILPSDLTGNLSYFLSGCKNLKTLPEGFTIPKGVTNITYMFRTCSSLESLPDSFSIPEDYSGAANHMFYGCTNLQTIPNNFIIPAGVTNLNHAFNNTGLLSGTITIKGNPDTYSECFRGTSISSGSTLTVNYSKNCTNIDDIIATGNKTYVVKGSQID